MSISIGMVGIGMFGRHFIQLFKEHPDVHRIALCDLRADRLAECSKQFEIEETIRRFVVGEASEHIQVWMKFARQT